MNQVVDDDGLGNVTGIIALLPLARSASPQLTGLFGSLRRIWRRLRSTPAERELFSLYRRTAEAVGQPLLEADGVDALTGMLDRATRNVELHALSARAFRCVTSSSFWDTARGDDEWSEDLDEVLGPPSAARVKAAFRLAMVAYTELLRLIARAGEQGRAQLTEAMRQHEANPLGFVYDESIPLIVRESLLKSVRSLPAMLAVAHATAIGRRLEPWRAHKLAEVVEEGQRAYLRILASEAGNSVPESVIPRDERFDVLTVAFERSQAALRVEDLVAKAKAAGVDVYPSDPE